LVRSAPLRPPIVLARLVIGRVVRRHGLLASFSPLPFEGGAGNGAHQHLPLTRDGTPLLSGGSGPRGLTAQGEAALAGIVTGLPELLGVFAGSVLSRQRWRSSLQGEWVRHRRWLAPWPSWPVRSRASPVAQTSWWTVP
jgi:glutamine synthetase